MRTGSGAVQQGLTQEAASIVKQAVTLAKRRGHAQVTPLHVASTMLSVTNGLLRNACLQSHSHPLQCKALELCFNVALNRLPASTSSPMLGPHHHHNQCPSISNALVAAFKRAQAHQRRGSIENQQQPLLTVKIEIEQLIISILDDPSVSRVMREARFSSLQVKSNVEQAVSLEICSKSNSNNNNNNDNSTNSSLSDANKSKKDHNNNNNSKALVLGPIIRDEDISSVIENLVMSGQRRIRSTVVVGECVGTLEGVVKGVMDTVEKGEVSEVLRGVKFVTLSLSSLVNLSRVEVEQKVQDLIKRSHCSSKGCVLYLGDLKWMIDYRASYSSNRQQGRVCYCPVDHMIMEIAKLVNGVGDNNNNNDGRFWIMGTATFQAYMKCKNGEPSLESLWGLHPVTIPSGSLSLSLITDSGPQNQPTNNTKSDDDRTSWLLLEGVGSDNDNNNNNNHDDDDDKKQPSKVETTEVRSLQSISSCNSDSSSSSLPPWLQHCKNENRGVTTTSNDQDFVQVGELCKKWNSSMCSSMQKLQPYHSSDKTLTLSPPSYSCISGFSYEHQNPITNKSHPFWISSSSNPSSNPNSTCSSDIVMEMEHVSKFKELNSENLNTLCNALERKVPWQKDIIHEIVSTLLQCRSGMRRRRKGNNDNNNYNDVKEETWFFFQGVDVEGAKEKIARELAKLVFGSQNNFMSISLSNFASSTRADSTEENYCFRNNKRSREEQSSCSYIERFIEAVSCNPHRVFLVEDIEQADYCSLLGFKRAIERGKVEDSSNGEEFGLCDAIIILSCESFSSRSWACSPNNYLTKQKSCEGLREEGKNNSIGETRSPNCVSLDLNISIDECGVDDEDRSVDEIGLVESVDRKVIFKIQELCEGEKKFQD